MSKSGRRSADDTLALWLARGATVKAAAAKAGVSRRTAHNRLNDDAFKAKVAALRRGLVGKASGRLAASMTKAAKVLHDLLADGDPAERRHAAVKLIELGLRTADLDDLEDKLRDLARRLDEVQPGWGKTGGYARLVVAETVVPSPPPAAGGAEEDHSITQHPADE